jgi:hypothetical protein
MMTVSALARWRIDVATLIRQREWGWGGVCFAVLFLLISGSMEIGDWWDLGKSSAWGRRLLVHQGAGAAFIALALTIILTWVRALSRNWKLVFLGWAAYLSVLLVAAWPGYLMSDSIASFAYGHEYPLVQWLGYFTPFLYGNITAAVPHVGAVTAFQALVCAVVIVYCGQTLKLVTGRGLASALFFVLLAVSPSAMFNVFLLSRDTLFSAAVLWLAAFLLRQYYLREHAAAAFAIAGCIAGWVVVLRGDGWLVVVPLAAILFWIVRPRAMTAIFVVTAAAFFTLYGITMPKLTGSRFDAFGYGVANTVNPLGYVLQSRHMQDPKQYLDHISRVVDVERIKGMQTPYEIPAWWTGKLIKPQATDEDKRGYFGAVRRFLLENPGVFLAGRVETFFGATGFYQDAFRYSDAYAEGWPPTTIPPSRLRLDPQAGRPVPALHKRIDGWFRESTIYEPGAIKGSVVHWNIIPALIILTACLLAYGVMPGVALASLIVLIRVPAVMLLAPASQYKYYLSAEFAGAFLFAAAVFLTLRRFERRRVSSRQ